MGEPALPEIILASGSAIRRQVLLGAGLSFRVETAAIDERSVIGTLKSRTPHVPLALLAQGLAEAKALEVSRQYPDAYVIGADQMLELDGQILHKAVSLEAAREQLLRLRGRRHMLHSGVAVARGRSTVWRTVQSASLSVRLFSEAWLEHYLARADDALTKSVGAYQLESIGVQLFDRFEGDYFTILGLPLVPLLEFLRSEGVMLS